MIQKLFSYLTLTLILATSAVLAQEGIPEMPSPPRLVNDYAGVLNNTERSILENRLVQFDDTSSTQIAIVIVKTLSGLTKEEYADQLGQKWGVGRKGKDNGILILIKPKYGNESGQARISVGYGLEGAVPDAIAKRIVDNEMIPSFKNGDYFSGLDKATKTLMALTSGEYSAEEYKKMNQPKIADIIVPIIIIILIIIIFGRNSGRHYNSGSKSTNFWTALWLASMMSNRGGGGSWGGGGGGFGGGGGGFGGFGGGGFGGGGAGGSW